MDTVIYSASALQAFLPALLTIGFLVILAIVGILFAFFRVKRQRIPLVIAGVFLLIVAVVFAAITLISMLTGSKSVDGTLSQKQVVERNCGEGSTCTDYVLSMNSGKKVFDFTVPQSAFEKAAEKTCYRVTYFPNNGLFPEPGLKEVYEASSNITRIEFLSPGVCP
jgi:hypothetical protein